MAKQRIPSKAPAVRGNSQLLTQAIALHGAGNMRDAAALYRKVLEQEPRNAVALYNLGLALDAMGDFAGALASFDAAMKFAPASAELHSSRGASLRMLGRPVEAVAAFRRAIAARASLVPAWHNMGNTLLDMGRFDEALDSFGTATRLAPSLAIAWFGKGLALRRLGREPEAVESFDRALALNSGHSTSWAARGESLMRMQRLDEAVQSMDRALALNPREPYVRGLRVQARLEACDWAGIDSEIVDLLAAVARGDKACPPFALLAVTDSGSHLLKAARTWIADHAPANDALGPFAARPARPRIRIGYFSMDFRNHAVSQLAAELFELHDRGEFEVFGFSYKREPDDAMTRRLQAGFDHLLDVAQLTDVEIAKHSRELGIDIAVDLGGLTQNARPGIFAARAAPIQVNYLGYAGSMGAPYMDWIVLDETIAPAASERDYDEKIARLSCFLVTDRKRAAAAAVSRSEAGLPQGCFVYGCLNRSAKILPGQFALWMRILQRVDRSVLMLHGAHPVAAQRLKAAAQAAGVDPSRLVLTGGLPLEQYLARLRHVDLFLDTFPFNGITVASDALWLGVPILTLSGESYVGRAGASLLEACGLSQLVARTPNEYVDKAVAAGEGRTDVHALKEELARERDRLPLFDTPRFVRELEDVYKRMIAALPVSPFGGT